MGGYAYIIKGTVCEASWVAPTRKNSLIARLLGSSKSDKIRRTSMGDSVLVRIPAHGLSQRFHDAFLHYLDHVVPSPTQATFSIIEYLKIAKTEVYLRGEEKNGLCEYYAQITFSGCAGMGEVSAEVAAHWAALWIQDCLEDFIKPTLKDYGFEVNEVYQEVDDFKFIEVEVDDHKYYGSIGFDGGIELDGALYEGLNEDYDLFNKRLAEEYSSNIESAVCECQLCETR
ncbi:MAG: hypothetical protein ACSHXL_02185 [Bacteroidota bacterium]